MKRGAVLHPGVFYFAKPHGILRVVPLIAITAWGLAERIITVNAQLFDSNIGENAAPIRFVDI
jgi:hypothetical protein